MKCNGKIHLLSLFSCVRPTQSPTYSRKNMKVFPFSLPKNFGLFVVHCERIEGGEGRRWGGAITRKAQEKLNTYPFLQGI
jgi:hypothetical protein